MHLHRRPADRAGCVRLGALHHPTDARIRAVGDTTGGEQAMSKREQVSISIEQRQLFERLALEVFEGSVSKRFATALATVYLNGFAMGVQAAQAKP